MLNFDYLNNLNDKQKEAVTCLNGPLLVVAGAGSGKTKVLTSRITHIIFSGKASPNEILAVTFTNKAASEMLGRVLSNLKKKRFGMPWIGTFHSICVKILRKHAKAAELNYNFTIVDQEDQKKLIKNICKSENVDTKKISPNYILNIIEKWKNKGWYPKDVVLKKSERLELSFLKIYKIYQSKLIDLNACDFNDLILHCIKIFETNPDIAKMYSKNFKYILVDEYQDTNFIQSKWLRLLSEKNKNICCVGDDDQSIYSWRGAEIKNFLDFDKMYKNTKIIRLEKNYRSTQNILSVASKLIENNQNRVGKKLFTNGENGDLVSLNCYRSVKDEAIDISDKIEKYKKDFYSLKELQTIKITEAKFDEALCPNSEDSTCDYTYDVKVEEWKLPLLDVFLGPIAGEEGPMKDMIKKTVKQLLGEDLLKIAGYNVEKIQIYQTLPNNARVFRVKIDSVTGGFIFVRWNKDKNENYIDNKLIDPGIYFNLNAAREIMRQQTEKASFGVDDVAIQAPDQEQIGSEELNQFREEFKLKEEEKKLKELESKNQKVNRKKDRVKDKKVKKEEKEKKEKEKEK